MFFQYELWSGGKLLAVNKFLVARNLGMDSLILTATLFFVAYLVGPVLTFMSMHAL